MFQPQEISTPVSSTSINKVLLRACESCRLRKLRCLQDNLSASSGKCLRCTKSNRECLFTEPSRKRRRIRTDTRVAELEKEIKAMSTVLKVGSFSLLQKGVNVNDAEHTQINLDDQNVGQTNMSGTAEENRKSLDQTFDEALSNYDQSLTTKMFIQPSNDNCTDNVQDSLHNLSLHNDVVDRGMLSMNEATLLFIRYSNELVQHFPAVVLPQGSDIGEIRRSKPVLFLAIIAAASGSSDQNLNKCLNKEILQVYADRIAIKGEKSLELIQSMLITMIWYFPPDSFEELKFYQYIHMAATMALDIGIERKPKTARDCIQSPNSDIRGSENVNPLKTSNYRSQMDDQRLDSGNIESRRTLLACYLKCSSVSISTRRPNMLRFTTWMAECVDYLETSQDAAPTDKRLVAWVRLQRIMEEFGTAFAFDDPSETVSLIEPRTQLMLKGFEKKLEIWKSNTPSLVLNATSLIFFHVNNIYLHEISLHQDHDLEDFRPPYLVTTKTRSEGQTNLSHAYLDAISQCLSSAHSLLQVFLQMDFKTLQDIPVVNYVRITYAAVVLTKLHFSSCSINSEIAQFLDQESLQVSQHLDKLVVHLMKAARSKKNRVATKFLMIIMALKKWFSQQKIRAHQSPSQEEQIEPCFFIRPSEILDEEQPPRTLIEKLPFNHGITTNQDVMPRFSSVYDGDSKTSQLSLYLAHSKEIAQEAQELNLSASDGGVLAAVSPKTGCHVPDVVPNSFVENPLNNSADQNFDFNDFDMFEDMNDWITNENIFDDTTQFSGLLNLA